MIYGKKKLQKPEMRKYRTQQWKQQHGLQSWEKYDFSKCQSEAEISTGPTAATACIPA